MQGFFYICNMLARLLFILCFSPLYLLCQEVWIRSNENTICSNSAPSLIYIDFQNKGVPPYTFVYSIDNVNQDTIITSLNIYKIKTSIAGEYNIVYFSDAAVNGPDSITGSVEINVNFAPTASINVSEDTISNIAPRVRFFNFENTNIVNWIWDFDDGNLIYEESPTYIFPTNDISISSPYKYFPVKLVVEDFNGCLDTAYYNICMKSDYFFYIPNSFTPDNDGLNDKLCVEYSGIRESTFLFNIFDSEGGLVFRTEDINILECSADKGWDGTHYLTKKDLPADTYMYEFYFQDLEGWKKKDFGLIILVR